MAGLPSRPAAGGGGGGCDKNQEAGPAFYILDMGGQW